MKILVAVLFVIAYSFFSWRMLFSDGKKKKDDFLEKQPDQIDISNQQSVSEFQKYQEKKSIKRNVEEETKNDAIMLSLADEISDVNDDFSESIAEEIYDDDELSNFYGTTPMLAISEEYTEFTPDMESTQEMLANLQEKDVEDISLSQKNYIYQFFQDAHLQDQISRQNPIISKKLNEIMLSIRETL